MNYPPCMVHVDGEYRCTLGRFRPLVEPVQLPIICDCAFRRELEGRPEPGPLPPPKPPTCDTLCTREINRAWQLARRPVVSEEEKQERLALCEACERFGEGRIASVLGMGSFHCPLEKF